MKFETNEKGGWIVPPETEIPAGTGIPDFSQLGDDCTLGDDCRLGGWCTLGDDCTLGGWCTLGDDCTLGDGCTLEGVTATWFMTAANIDGSGRQVLIVQHADGFRIRAGCFVGTLDEFCDKAEADGKTTYSAVVRAICEARLTCNN